VARKAAKPASAAGELEPLARAALLEVTPAATVGALVETRAGAEEGLTELVFESAQRGYVGWSWVVTLASVHDGVSGEAQPPTVLELGLVPGEAALLAPEWVPWSVRLAEWEAQQATLAAAGETPEDDELDDDADEDEDLDDDLDDDDDDSDDDDSDEDDDDLDDDEDDDFEDVDDDAPMLTHAGDIDGVDIDALDDED